MKNTFTININGTPATVDAAKGEGTKIVKLNISPVSLVVGQRYDVRVVYNGNDSNMAA